MKTARKVQLPLFRRAVKGFVVMTDELEAIGKGLFMNTVPEGARVPLHALNVWRLGVCGLSLAEASHSVVQGAQR